MPDFMRHHVTEQGSWIGLGPVGHRFDPICEHRREAIGMVPYVDG
jgi:hypothetical protein